MEVLHPRVAPPGNNQRLLISCCGTVEWLMSKWRRLKFTEYLSKVKKIHVFPLTLFKKIWKFNVGNTFFFNYYLGNTVQESD